VHEVTARATKLDLQLLLTSHQFVAGTERPAPYYVEKLGMNGDGIMCILSKMDSSGVVHLSIAKSMSDAPTSIRALAHRLQQEVRSRPRGLTAASATWPTVSMGEPPLCLEVNIQRLCEDRWRQRTDTTRPCCIDAL